MLWRFINECMACESLIFGFNPKRHICKSCLRKLNEVGTEPRVQPIGSKEYIWDGREFVDKYTHTTK